MVRALGGVLAAACRARPGFGSGQAAGHGLVTAAPEDRARRQAAGGATRRRLAAVSLR